MKTGLPLFPDQASTFAEKVDMLYFFLVSVSGFFSVLIFALVFYFALRYRRRRPDEVPPEVHGSLALEIAWTIPTLVLSMVMFAWGATLYFQMTHPPDNALRMDVVGKQWMWKIQHPEGRREINELHIPLGTPVRLNMISEDVIHSFYIPAFRVKQDVLPGRYSQLWFQATRTGEFHLFCAEYCGTKHSGMIGRVVVLDPAEYQQWLSGAPPGETLEASGERLFVQMNCNTCHHDRPGARGPVLEGIFGRQQRMATGETVTADEAYLRESILLPNARVLAGYSPVMPTYQGQIAEEGVLQLIAYIKSLSKKRSGLE